MKASEVATELRRIADALDVNPELGIEPYLAIYAENNNKKLFLQLARIMPRPMAKGVDFEGTTYSDLKLEHSFWCIKIPQSEMCTIIEPARPAKFDCPSIFSDEEEAELASAQS